MGVPFHKPYITDDEINGVVESLKSGWVTTGPKAKQFEEEFTEYIGSKHAIAVNSCTAALHLAIEAIGLKENDEVITTPMTFAATAEVIRYFRAKPVFVDIDPETFNIDVEKVEAEVKKLKAKNLELQAIIPVHYAGHPCDMDPIMQVANTYNLKVVEDAAHTLPSTYKNRNIGTIGNVTCFSFYATKNITTGEGGMITTDNEEYAERMRIMRLHGINKDAWERYTSKGNWYYEIVAPGYKYNMTDMAAALGLAQLKKANFMWERRKEIAAKYNEVLKDFPAITPPATKGDVAHSWHLYVIKLNLEMLNINRDQFIEELRKKNIGASVHFIPLHIHPYYRDKYGYVPEDFPVAYETYTRIVSLPIYPKMTDEDVQKVIEAVANVCRKCRR